MRKTAFFISLSILIFSFATAFYFYLDLPTQIVTHWGIDGQPNGFSHKNIVLFLPFLTMLFYFLFIFIPKIDPLKENIKKFSDVYDDFVLVFLLFMFYMSSLTLLWNLGLKFDMIIAIVPAISFLFFFIGTMLDDVKRNYFIGIRTPWTLVNDDVWDKTNALGAKLFKGIAIISLLSIVFPAYSFFVFFITTIISVIYIFFYSYFEYVKVKDEKKKK